MRKYACWDIQKSYPPPVYFTIININVSKMSNTGIAFDVESTQDMKPPDIATLNVHRTRRIEGPKTSRDALTHGGLREGGQAQTLPSETGTVSEPLESVLEVEGTLTENEDTMTAKGASVPGQASSSIAQREEVPSDRDTQQKKIRNTRNRIVKSLGSLLQTMRGQRAKQHEPGEVAAAPRMGFQRARIRLGSSSTVGSSDSIPLQNSNSIPLQSSDSIPLQSSDTFNITQVSGLGRIPETENENPLGLHATTVIEIDQQDEADQSQPMNPLKNIVRMVIHTDEGKTAIRLGKLDTGASVNIIRVVDQLGMTIKPYSGNDLSSLGSISIRPSGKVDVEWHSLSKTKTYHSEFLVLDTNLSRDFDVLLSAKTIQDVGFYRLGDQIW